MPIDLDHALVPAHNRDASAKREIDNKVDPTYGNCYWNEPEGHVWELLQVSYARKK